MPVSSSLLFVTLAIGERSMQHPGKFGAYVRTATVVVICSLWGAGAFHVSASYAAGDQRVTFFVLGDPQIHETFLRKFVKQIVAEDPSFVLIPGDCCMANGADPAPWDQFFDIFGPLYGTPNRRLYAIPGNHDVDGDFAAALRSWKDRWDLPGPEVYYSFTRSNIHVVGLFVTNGSLFRCDSNIPPLHWPEPVGDTWRSQIDWLREDLANVPEGVDWKILFHHEPGARYCRLGAPEDGPGDSGVSAYVEPLAQEAGVDLIIRGHQHMYERTWPIDIATGRRDDLHGVTMITTGGGCTAFRPLNPDNARPLWFDAVTAAHRAHYCKVVIEGNRLTWEAIDLAGDVFDRFEIVKHPDGTRTWVGLSEEARFVAPPKAGDAAYLAGR